MPWACAKNVQKHSAAVFLPFFASVSAFLPSLSTQEENF